MELTREDIELLKRSLEYTKKAFREYDSYPSYEFKQMRLREVSDLQTKLSIMKKEISNEIERE
mgnify:CR=1 FL=1